MKRLVIAAFTAATTLVSVAPPAAAQSFREFTFCNGGIVVTEGMAFFASPTRSIYTAVFRMANPNAQGVNATVTMTQTVWGRWLIQPNFAGVRRGTPLGYNFAQAVPAPNGSGSNNPPSAEQVVAAMNITCRFY